MKTYLSATPPIMRNINQTAVLEYIRTNNGASRAVISKELGLSLPSVVRIIDDLLEKNFLYFTGEFEESGGRKRPLVKFNTEMNIAIGIAIGYRSAAGVVVDLGGNILTDEVKIKLSSEQDENIPELLELIQRLIKAAKKMDKILRGVSISVPAVTEPKEGIVRKIQPLGWKHLALKEIVEGRFAIPCIVENDANTAALAELWYGCAKDTYNFALISLRKGLGVGLVVGGSIYRGATNAAGELGHMVFAKEDFSRKQAEFGPIEHAIAGMGLIRQAQDKLRGLVEKKELESIDYQYIFSAYHKGKEWVQPIIEDFINILSMVIIETYSVINPERIVLTGEVMEYAEDLLYEIEDRIYEQIDVVISPLGRQAAYQGGAVSLLHRAMDYCVIRSTY